MNRETDSDSKIYEARGMVVRLSEKRYQQLEHHIKHQKEFIEPIDEFSIEKDEDLLVYVFDPAERLIGIGSGKKSGSAGTKMVKLKIEAIIDPEDPSIYREPSEQSSIFEIENIHKEPLTANEIIENIRPKIRQTRVRANLDKAGPLKQTSHQDIIGTILDLRPELQEKIERLLLDTETVEINIPPKQKKSLALQKDAVVMGFEVGGMSADFIKKTWSTEHIKSDTDCYLDGIDPKHLRKIKEIEDIDKVPGFKAVAKNTPHAATILFPEKQSGKQQEKTMELVVAIANRVSLEEQIGHNMVFFNEMYRAFLITKLDAIKIRTIQSQDRDDEIRRRTGDSQFQRELQNIENLYDKIPTSVPSSEDGDEQFRLNNNPFFLKFCFESKLNLGDFKLTQGMYLPVEYWKLLKNKSILADSNSSQSSEIRYFNNTDFLNLMSKAWVGATIERSEILEKWIDETLKAGHSVTFVVKREKGKAREKAESEEGFPLFGTKR